MAASETLVSLASEQDPYVHDPAEIYPLQLAALDERLQERRGQLPILDQRARDAGVDRISSIDDVVPLLFSHDTYKSYPDSFLDQGRWDYMCRWLETLSTTPVEGINLLGVTDIDEWLGRLWEGGHYVFCSSGTSGKSSLLDQSAQERGRYAEKLISAFRWMSDIAPNKDRAVFMLVPTTGSYKLAAVMDRLASDYGRSGAVYHLSERPFSAVETSRLGRLRRAMIDGRASPGDITALQEFSANRQEKSTQEISALVDALLAHRGEPIFFLGSWEQTWLIVNEAKERGADDGAYADSFLNVGGGLKNARLPDDYEEQIRRFFGVERIFHSYAMTEMESFMPQCNAGGYHCPPWVALLLLDEKGEQLMDRGEGIRSGRMGFFDFSIDSRWGGLISGDNVTVDFDQCGCGRPGPTVTNVGRYIDLGDGDDKLTCAGTMDAYIRGVIE